MGISTFWEIIGQQAGETEVHIQSLSGRKVAVDLSSWIVEFNTAPSARITNNHYNVIKLVFYRTVALMKEGLQLVFVEDGCAPDLKRDAIHQRQLQQYGASRRSGNLDRPRLQRAVAEVTRTKEFYTSCITWKQKYKKLSVNIVDPDQKCKPLLTALGIPCIKSQAEAEAMCAYLDMKGYVNGCFTSDSDFFCYGGKTLYRNLRKEKQRYAIDIYKDDAIRTAYGLSRRDMVAMALVLRSDYDQKGVPGIGKEGFKVLFKYFQSKGFDMLDRLVNWRDNKELDDVKKRCENSIKRESHCSSCKHLGTVQGHQRRGCAVCATNDNCIRDPDKVKPCQCPWHEQQQVVEEHKVEMTARRKALSHSDFPNKEVMNEYLNTLTANSVDPAQLERHEINVPQVLSCLRGKLSPSDILRKLVPAVIYAQLRKNVVHEDLMYTPIRIIRPSQEKFVASYLVAWDKTDKNSWAPEEEFSTNYELNVDRTLFSHNFPAMVRKFEDAKADRKMSGKKSAGQKRKLEKEDHSQSTLEDFIRPKRRLAFNDVTEAVIESSRPSEADFGRYKVEPMTFNNVAEPIVESSGPTEVVGCKVEPKDRIFSPKLARSDETALVAAQNKPGHAVNKGDQVSSKSPRNVVFSKNATESFNDVDINTGLSTRTANRHAEVICIGDSDDEQLGCIKNNNATSNGESKVGKVEESASSMSWGKILGNNKDKLESSSNGKKRNCKKRTQNKQPNSSKSESNKQGSLLKFFTLKKS